MSRNATSRFAENPTNISIPRSSFDRDSSVKMSFNVGDLVPFYIDEVLPGDTFDVSTSRVVRLQTPITPFMDNMFLDTYYFFVPSRIVWDHWKEFNGENTQSAWYPTTEYEVPQITAPSGGWNIGTIADYMGIPTGVEGLSVSALPFRAYAMICNEWFRDENLSDPLVFDKGDATVVGVNTGSYVTDVAKGGMPFKAAKYHDYFTSCLPAPQKGPDVGIGLTGNVPVLPVNGMTNTTDAVMTWSGPEPAQDDYAYSIYGSTEKTTFNSGQATTSTTTVYPNNLFGNLGDVNAVTINQLRMAFQLQRLYEKDARGGTRYVEMLKAHFGVTSPDARQQRPEYLGGNRIPVQVNQVIQTSSSVTDSAQGNAAAYSLTTDMHNDFTKSFTEHGFVLGLCVCRYTHTYQQGIERLWSRKSRFDFYYPALANIGEQAVLNKEIYAQGTDADSEVFGYQEAWAEYRYKPNRVAGEMRSQATASLDVWHLADDYSTLPTLSDGWIREDTATVNRVLTVSSEVSNQLFGDFYIRNKTTRVMPVYSIPGLIDHN